MSDDPKATPATTRGGRTVHVGPDDPAQPRLARGRPTAARAGYTLIELLVLTTIGAVMVGVAVSLLTLLLRAAEGGRRDFHQDNVLRTLREQFRRDVHAATQLNTATRPATEDGDRGTWRLDLGPEPAVSYRAQPGRILRIRRAEGRVRQRESFRLPEDASAALDVERHAGSRVASLTITARPAPRAAPPGDAPSVPGRLLMRIDAVLGKDHRFDGSPRAAGEADDE